MGERDARGQGRPAHRHDTRATGDEEPSIAVTTGPPSLRGDVSVGGCIRRGEGGGVGKGGPLWSPASCSLCSLVGEHDHPYRRPGKPTHPCIVGAGLAPALPRCTRSFIRQQRPLWPPAVVLLETGTNNVFGEEQSYGCRDGRSDRCANQRLVSK